MGAFVKKVLFLRFSSLGDIIIANYTAMKIKEKHPDWHLSWLTEKLYSDIISVQPWVDSVISWDRKNGGKREYIEIIRNVRESKFDILVDMHATDRSSLFSLISGIPIRYGCEKHYPFVHTTFDMAPFIDIGNGIKECKKYLYPAPNFPERFSFLLHNKEKSLALPIGASYTKKQWGVRRWAEFCTMAAAEGIRMILLGSGEEEAAQAKQIEKEVASALLINLVGRLSLKELVQVINICDMAVSGDTGAAHIARALGVPTAVMFGPTVLSDGEYMSSLKNIFKTTCQHVGCGLFDCQKPCMETIEVAPVIECVRNILAEKK